MERLECRNGNLTHIFLPVAYNTHLYAIERLEFALKLPENGGRRDEDEGGGMSSCGYFARYERLACTSADSQNTYCGLLCGLYGGRLSLSISRLLLGLTFGLAVFDALLEECPSAAEGKVSVL